MLARMTVKAVNNAIDKQTLSAIPGQLEIMRGSPVFRSARFPIYMIAMMLEKGEVLEGEREVYPALTAEMIRLAPIYANAYPLQARPRAQPWHDRPPVYPAPRRLDPIEIS